MNNWLTEAIEQIALGEYLATTKLSCGQRFGLIAIDNAVEFMLISYVENYRQLVGKPQPPGVGKKLWEEKKRAFPDLLAFVAGVEPKLSSLEADITVSHKLRNDLYHTGMPITVAEGRVLQYSKLARNILSTLFGFAYSQTAWDSMVHAAALTISKEAAQSPKLPVEFEALAPHIRLVTAEMPTARDAIALCLYGCSTRLGTTPTKAELAKSLELSAKPMNDATLTSRLTDMRREGLLRSDVLKLKEKAIKALQKKFIM